MTTLTLAPHVQRLADQVAGCLCTTGEGVSLSGDEGIAWAVAMLKEARERGSTVYLVGNGGGAAAAGHVATDLIQRCGVRAATLHDAPLLSRMIDDCGREHAISRVLAVLARSGDVLVVVGDAGDSLGLIHAARAMKAFGGQVITLTGFGADNPLRGLGGLNFWVGGEERGLVEVAHLFLLHHLAERLRVSCQLQ